jgi:hypothetical protein
MEKQDIEELRDRVPCAAVLDSAGWAVDLKESTRRAVKYRRGDAIIIVIHDGKGWFDPLSDAKGDVYSLAAFLDDVGFAQALEHVRSLVGFVPTEPAWTRPSRHRDPVGMIPERWRARKSPWPRSATWRYLAETRAIPGWIITEAVRQGRLREGPQGSMWAAHCDAAGAVTGWEERGPDWRGFATGGLKHLFRLGPADATRVYVTEAAIDAMSLAAIEGAKASPVLFVSTGGGWSPVTDAAIITLAARPGTLLVAATDANRQGEVFAGRLRDIATTVGCGYERRTPAREDWNETLKGMRREEGGGQPAAACPVAASRVKLCPPVAALDPPDRRGGHGGGVRKG